MSNNPYVVIVGAGYVVGVAEQLAHLPVAVTLIDRHNYHTFQPLLHQAATSLLNAEEVAERKRRTSVWTIRRGCQTGHPTLNPQV